MKVGSIIKKTFSSDLLALALACMVSLLFTQNNAHYSNAFYKKSSEIDIAVTAKKESGSKQSQPEPEAISWIGNIAVLNSQAPVFQLRDNLRFFLNVSVNQYITTLKHNRNKEICSCKTFLYGPFSITILYCQLLI